MPPDDSPAEDSYKNLDIIKNNSLQRGNGEGLEESILEAINNFRLGGVELGKVLFHSF